MSKKVTLPSEGKINPYLEVLITNSIGEGGANHEYSVNLIEGVEAIPLDRDRIAHRIRFQRGPFNEVGINGITEEVLLTIVADRLASFEKGPFPSIENKIALKAIEIALFALKTRTLNRLERGVEGTNLA